MKKVFRGGTFRLETPLGNWNHNQTWTANWQWYVSSDRYYLYHRMTRGRNHIFIGYILVLHLCSVPYQPVTYFVLQFLSKDVDGF